jgi:hypothetical protein
VHVFVAVASLDRRLAQNPNPNTSSLHTLLRGDLGFGGCEEYQMGAGAMPASLSISSQPQLRL